MGRGMGGRTNLGVVLDRLGMGPSSMLAMDAQDQGVWVVGRHTEHRRGAAASC